MCSSVSGVCWHVIGMLMSIQHIRQSLTGYWAWKMIVETITNVLLRLWLIGPCDWVLIYYSSHLILEELIYLVALFQMWNNFMILYKYSSQRTPIALLQTWDLDFKCVLNIWCSSYVNDIMYMPYICCIAFHVHYSLIWSLLMWLNITHFSCAYSYQMCLSVDCWGNETKYKN